MGLKNRHKKSTLRHKRKSVKRRYTIKRKKYTMRGGNYETDITTRTTDGIPTKPLNKIVVTVPGYGTMSGTAYKRLSESIDRDGPDGQLK
jgi:hypothetical protein